MAIASIAQYDWPENWPDLLPLLLKLIGDQTNMYGVRGALRCLALISGDLDDKLMPTLVPVLFPCLYRIISSPHIYEKPLRTKALSILYSCTSMLGVMSGIYKAEINGLMMPMLKLWMEQFSVVLQPSVKSEDPDDWSIKMEVLKCLIQFVVVFPSLTEAELSVTLGPLWQTFVSCLEVYQLSSIQGIDDPYSGRVDSDGAERSLESFAIQLFEFLLTIVGNPRLVKVIGGNFKELVYYTIAFLQMTEEQVHTWSLDANQYVADEDDATYSCRVSGILLLEEVVTAYGAEGVDAIIEAAQKRFNESCQAKIAGSTDWWRLREAVIFALFSLSESLSDGLFPESSKVILGSFLEQMLIEIAGTGVHEYPFLHARAFSAVSKLSSVVIRQEVLEQFLCASIKAIAVNVPPPVKVGACRVISHLLPESNQSILQSQILSLLSSLTDLLKQASDETLHLVLEALQAAVKAGQEVSASVEQIISPIILNMWVEHVSDPFICVDIVEVLEAIKYAPGCMRPLISRILPYIGPILEKPQQQPTGLAAASLDLLTMLLKNAPIDIVKIMYDVCFNHAVQIILQSDDHSEMQNATECLAAFVLAGKQELLDWGGDPGFTMKSLLSAASRLLDPNMESSGSLFVGTYILQLILHLPSQMAHHIRDLVAALVKRMQSCQMPELKSSLLLILARLVHLSAPNVGQFVDLLITVPAEGHENSLSYVMSEWVKHQGEIQGAYQIKVTTTALALLLSTQHVELAKIHVQGHIIKTTAGITTRSIAKLVPDQWTVMPLPAKILALVADMLIEIQEQDLDDNDEDSDWEEVHDTDTDPHNKILYSMGSSNARPTIEHLDAMANALNESEDENYGDDFLKGSDPINEINLAKYLLDFFAKFSNGNRAVFDHLCHSLTPAQRNAIQTVLKQ
ncbi:ARM repeat superfamily protein isoform X1 [Tasmannia lanceolata]|uniref:ARM repeat superfamily protein isoform X1 n=2 Tax=Tasmannia lanceolata TaxID=3420 RepID=UPI00406333A6